MSVRRLPRRVGSALERHVERMAGSGKGGVELQRGERHEALQLLRARHRSCAVQADQGNQGAVAADQRTAAVEGNGRLGRQKALQRLAAQRPAQALEVVRGGCERERHGPGVLRASA